jgi:cellulose synthase/poly-beta-1,6-N-acetylglucosamine synthase-like glycosyltransferase
MIERPAKRFSIVVPTYNAPTIDRTIESLEHLEFDRREYEVIVVGVDHSGRVRSSDLVRFDRTAQRLPPAVARNRGASQVTGEILVFIDADCIARPDWLMILAKQFVDPTVTIVGGGIEFENRNYWTLADNLSMFYEFRAARPPALKLLLPSLNLAIRREVFQQFGGFDERYPRPSGEDSDLTTRLRLKGHLLRFDPRAVVLHAPPRDRLRDLLRHSFYQGKYSIKVDPRYAQTVALAWPLRTRLGVICAAPVLATLAAVRVIGTSGIRAYWHMFPAVWVAKLAWCAGAACRPQGGVNWGQRQSGFDRDDRKDGR